MLTLFPENSAMELSQSPKRTALTHFKGNTCMTLLPSARSHLLKVLPPLNIINTLKTQFPTQKFLEDTLKPYPILSSESKNSTKS